jgi:hypothetical protein
LFIPLYTLVVNDGPRHVRNVSRGIFASSAVRGDCSTGLEYYRTYLIEWIYLYFESVDASYKTFGDAFKSYGEGFGRESKMT